MIADSESRFAAGTGAVDAENPWPGLASFREADREFFHGRDAEAAELARLIQRERLTMLFGLSGLGKTSLLQAGLFPRLRQAGVFPVSLRLSHADGHPPFRAQIYRAVAREAEASGVAAPAAAETLTLWECFHRRDSRFAGPDGGDLIPLLVFDQFEEVFTLGRRDAATTRETEAFLAELADWIEGRPAAEVLERLERNPEEARDLVFGRHNYKVLLSLREDFLPDLEGLRGRMRSVSHNRLRLRRLSGESALLAVIRAGGHLIEPAVAERVVRFVAGEDATAGTSPLADLEVEPALLSVVCRELNTKRLKRGDRQITAGLLEGSREEILTEFYERSVDDVGAAVRAFVEDRLLTQRGYRDNVALEDALESPGVSREAIDRLVGRRLLRIEDRGGVQRLEVTHDVLTGVIRASRDSRRQRQAQDAAEAREQEAHRKLRSSQMVTALLAILLAFGGVAFWRAHVQKDRAQEAARQAEEARARAERAQGSAERALAAADFKEAMSLSEKGRTPEALAYLSDATRREPNNRQFRDHLLSLLLHRSWPLPLQVMRHDAAIFDARLSPDGERIVTASRDGTARLWNAATGQPIGAPMSHDGWVVQAVFSKQGDLVATASLDKTARLWDARTGRPVGSPLRHGGWVTGLAFSRDGQRLLTESLDGTARLWDTKDGRSRAIMRHKDEVNSADFSPDGLRVVTASDDKTARLWDGLGGRPLGSVMLHEQAVATAGFNPHNGSIVTATRTGMVRFWNGQTGTPLSDPVSVSPLIHSALFSQDGRHLLLSSSVDAPLLIDFQTNSNTSLLPATPIEAADFSRDGRRLLTVTQDHLVHLWNLDAWPPVDTGAILRHGLMISSAEFSQDGHRVLTASMDGSVCLWDVRAGRLSGAPMRHDKDVSSMWLGPSGWLVLSAFEGGSLVLWDARTGTPAGPPMRRPSRVLAAELSADGRLAATASEDRAARAWDTHTGKSLGMPMRHQGAIHSIRLSPNGRLIVTASEDKTAQVWNALTGRPLGQRMRHEDAVTTAEIDPSGSRVLTVSKDGAARIWDARTGQPIGTPMRQELPISDAHFSPEGRRVITISLDRAQLWDAHTFQPIGRPMEQDRPDLMSVLFSPDGKMMATTSLDFTARLWSAESGGPIGEPMRHQGLVSDVAFSPDGRRLATGSLDGTVRLWDTATGRSLSEPLRQANAVAEVRFSPDGRQVITASWDGTARVWDILTTTPEETADLIALAEAIGGYKVQDGNAVPIPDSLSRLAALRRKSSGAGLGEPTFSSFLRWFLSDPWERTVSPLSKVTAAEYVRRSVAEKSEAARLEAARAFPGHPGLADASH